jgi:DeoR/GlpR family transcriptional regulator of sugar metabolism
MGASAVDLDNGFMTEQVREIAVDRALRGIARQAVILADATKLDRMAPGFMFGFEQVGVLVTDDRIESRMRAALEARGVTLVVASSD